MLLIRLCCSCQTVMTSHSSSSNPAALHGSDLSLVYDSVVVNLSYDTNLHRQELSGFLFQIRFLFSVCGGGGVDCFLI